MIGGVCINIFNISGLPPLARSCYTEAAAAVQSAVSADGPGRPCCPGEVIHDLEQVVPRARTASMDYSRLFDRVTWHAGGTVPVFYCCCSNDYVACATVRSRFLPSRRWRPQSASPGRTVTLLTADRFTSRPNHVGAVVHSTAVLVLVGGAAPDPLHDSAASSLLLWLRLQLGPRRRWSASGWCCWWCCCCSRRRSDAVPDDVWEEYICLFVGQLGLDL